MVCLVRRTGLRRHLANIYGKWSFNDLHGSHVACRGFTGHSHGNFGK